MHPLRRARHLTALVLAWFVLALGVAAAAPALKPAQVQWVCSGSGASLVLHEEGGSPTAHDHAAKGALCGLLAPPSPQAGPSFAKPSRHGAAPAIAAASPHVRQAAAPLPPRGPPARA